MKKYFEKYNGLGNDFIITNEEFSDYEIKKICKRRFSIGADGIIFLKFKDGLPFMDYRNADGSIAKMCGNGIRCYTHYLYNNGYIDKNKNNLTIDTLSGIKEIEYAVLEDSTFMVKVDMGKAENDNFHQKIKVFDREFEYFYTFTGTDHIVIFIDEKELKEDFVIKYGCEIEKLKNSNVNFVSILNRDSVKVITYERGSGLTYACGSGTVASCYVANKLNKVDKKIEAILLGGILYIEVYENKNIMIGKSEYVFNGYIEI